MLAIIVVALLILGYTYIGYPVLLSWLVRLGFGKRPLVADKEQEVTSGSAFPRVSVLLPAFNAADYLPAKIDSLLAQSYPPDRIEILVYCDGCRDATESVARDMARLERAQGRITVVSDSVQRGKPSGLNRLAAMATGDLLLLNDIRQPLSPNTIADLAATLADPGVGVATGKLVLSGSDGSGVYWRYEEWIRGRESRFRGMVGMTGPLGMIRRHDFRSIPSRMILDDVWLPMSLVHGGKRVVMVPEAKAFDTAFSDDRELSRKLRTLAGNYQVISSLPWMMVPFFNPIWFETFSHKVLRLIAPWMLLALFGASVGAAVDHYGAVRALLAAQLLFYGAAAAGPRAGKIGAVSRTFVVLNAAVIGGLWRFLTGDLAVTWKTGRESAPSSVRTDGQPTEGANKS